MWEQPVAIEEKRVAILSIMLYLTSFMGREKCFKKGSKKPRLLAKLERIAKKPEGRISLNSSRPTLIWILSFELADSKEKVFSFSKAS